MFLSRLKLNLRDRGVRRDLANTYDMHRTLLRAFPNAADGGPGRVLFRVDQERSEPSLVLVQSSRTPTWSALPVGYLLDVQTKPLDRLTLVSGQRLRFRLRANPTKRVAAKNERLGGVMVGKRIGLTTEADQVRWLLRKGEASGFRIPGAWVEAKDPETNQPIQLPNFRVDVVPDGRDLNGKPGHAGEFVAVRFDGVLVVTDPDAFRNTIAAGIGTGKAFGFGLLSVAPAEG